MVKFCSHKNCDCPSVVKVLTESFLAAFQEKVFKCIISNFLSAYTVVEITKFAYRFFQQTVYILILSVHYSTVSAGANNMFSITPQQSC